MYGFRQIAGHCVDCMTHDEAVELALTYVNAGGTRYRVTGELIQHFGGHNVTREHVYCWHVEPTTELSKHGNQRIARESRLNGRGIPAPS
jgi:alkylation response protein AidB-like acyl-CoA dehydrogenase